MRSIESEQTRVRVSDFEPVTEDLKERMAERSDGN